MDGLDNNSNNENPMEQDENDSDFEISDILNFVCVSLCILSYEFLNLY
jgi:hypothetical protein